MNKIEKKKLCSGCRSNRYNMGVGYRETSIDAPVTCTECWSFATAKVCNKMVYYSPSDINPHLKKHTLSCWHNELGYGERVK